MNPDFSNKKTTLSEWFSPCDQEHLKAYNHLCETGFWPENFVPDSIEVDNLWNVKIMSKISNVYISGILSGDLIWKS